MAIPPETLILMALVILPSWDRPEARLAETDNGRLCHGDGGQSEEDYERPV